MSLISRVKRLWELSGTRSPTVGDLVPPLPDFVFTYTGNEPMTQATAGAIEPGRAMTIAPRRMATIVADDPLDVFPSEDPEHEGELT